MEPAELLKRVDQLAKAGMTQKEIAAELGFRTPFTLSSHLVKASQATGKPVPAFRQAGTGKLKNVVETVEVKRRGKGEAFGVNVPMEPLVRAGVKPGTRFAVKVRKGRIVLVAQ